MNNRFETFTVLINQISRNIRKIKNQEMADYNLRSSHISMLLRRISVVPKQKKQDASAMWIPNENFDDKDAVFTFGFEN